MIVLEPWEGTLAALALLGLGFYAACLLWAHRLRVGDSIVRDAEQELDATRQVNRYFLDAMDDREESVRRRSAIVEWHKAHKGGSR